LLQNSLELSHNHLRASIIPSHQTSGFLHPAIARDSSTIAKKTFKPKRSGRLGILYTNADGILGKSEELKDLVAETKPDVAITETKLSIDIANCIVFPQGYEMMRKDRENGRGVEGPYVFERT